MIDEADMASGYIDHQVSVALKKIQQNQQTEKTSKTKSCIECGETLPKPRQKLGFNRCIGCAEKRERQRSLFKDF